MTRVLVVDDEPQLLRALRITLTGRRFEVVTAETGRQALQAVSERAPDIVVLDLGLPDMDGVDVVRQLRTWTAVPILVLSGRMASDAKVAALDAGADDYVTKPFNVEELLARLRAVTRRVGPAERPAPVRIGRWEVDVADRRATLVGAGGGAAGAARDAVDAGDASETGETGETKETGETGETGEEGEAGEAGEALHLTPIEWQLLEVLVRHPGRLVGHRQLLHDVWGPAYGTQTHYLRQYMKHLRRKLEDEPARPRHLLTEPGMGYRFHP